MKLVTKRILTALLVLGLSFTAGVQAADPVVVSCGKNTGNCWYCLFTFDFGPECLWDGSPRVSCTSKLSGGC